MSLILKKDKVEPLLKVWGKHADIRVDKAMGCIWSSVVKKIKILSFKYKEMKVKRMIMRAYGNDILLSSC